MIQPQGIIKARWRGRFIRLLLGATFGLFAAECIARLMPASSRLPFSHNPIIASQALLVDVFVPDEELGHRLKDGFVRVNGPGLVSLQELRADERHKGRLVILNIGDSSTSGWDGNRSAEDVFIQAPRPRDPFHFYRTYSDILADDDGLFVINAGVPGFTSLQGARYLASLLPTLEHAGLQVAAVTIYFGNNDASWDGNIEDIYRLPDSWIRPRLPTMFQQACQRFKVFPRVPPSTFAKNLRTMIALCEDRGIRPIIIEPPVPKTWPPGLRAKQLKASRDKYLIESAGTKTADLCSVALVHFAAGIRAISNGDHTTAYALLAAAIEDDYLVPRIKQSYIRLLHTIAQEFGVPLVSLSDRIPLQDSEFFCDYCHPIEPANRLIAEGIIAALKDLPTHR